MFYVFLCVTGIKFCEDVSDSAGGLSLYVFIFLEIFKALVPLFLIEQLKSRQEMGRERERRAVKGHRVELNPRLLQGGHGLIFCTVAVNHLMPVTHMCSSQTEGGVEVQSGGSEQRASVHSVENCLRI